MKETLEQIEGKKLKRGFSPKIMSSKLFFPQTLPSSREKLLKQTIFEELIEISF